ncbi:hypothetical protein DY000_02031492 [Brassica cretica]|uniref:Uncharacterized protein n=1 Tax=Brassica cretica TaxID=69181 RepID=A0ABQ7DGL1_BRACR|nr:hypothetical protein DY000_02031492 [Brassica cretica]
MWVLDLGAFLSPEFFLRTRNISFKGPYFAILGEATIGTCWDFVFCRSEAGHYRVLVLHAASAGSHYRLRGCWYFSRLGIYLVWDPDMLEAIQSHFSLRVSQDRRSLGPDPARLPL